MHFLCLRNTHCKLLLQGRSFCTNVVKEGLITVILCCVEELVGPYYSGILYMLIIIHGQGHVLVCICSFMEHPNSSIHKKN